MGASAFNVLSERAVKTDFADLDALGIVKDAKAQQWKYLDHIEAADRWHAGPMLEDLPERFHNRFDGDHMSYDIGTIQGIQWEALRLLIGRVEALENGQE